MMDYSKEKEIWLEACQAGKDAAEKVVPRPMVVTDGSGFRDVIEDGVCGFAWVNIKPANSRFAKYLLTSGFARRSEYYGGIQVWISQYNQSYARKYAHAAAVAAHLKAHLPNLKVYASGRLD